jgi:epsilon-lactone hydrolase
MSRWTERVYSVPRDVQLVTLPRGGLTYEWLIPQSTAPRRVLFHIHGGGFVFPLYNPSRYTTAYLAREAHTRALLVDYRLAPEHPFPAALLDCVAAYRWLTREAGCQPEDIVFTGESAGGNLVVTTLLALREAGDPMPAGAAAICPALDFEARGTFYHQNDVMSHPRFAMLHLDAYRGRSNPRDPLLSPLYADLRDLPPMLIQVGGNEIFRWGAEALHARATEQGVRATLRVWPGMWHFWHMYAPWLPEARGAMKEIADFVNSCWAER